MSTSTSTSTRPAPPTTVTVAFVLWLLTVLLGIVGSVLLLVVAGEAGVEGVIIAVVALVIAIAELIVLFKMRAGRNWARIVLTVLAVLQIGGTVSGSATNSWVQWVGLGAVVVSTILMYLPASNAYFKANATR